MAFDYRDCEYLVYLCDWNKIVSDIDADQIKQDTKQHIFNICVQRFIENLIKYEQNFMEVYFRTHRDNIETFLCRNIRNSDIWKSYKTENDQNVDIDVLLNQCISYHLAHSAQNETELSMIDEYASLHNIAINNFTNTAKQLFDTTITFSNNYDLNEQNINLSMAKLSVFVDDEDEKGSDDTNIDDIEQELIWVNAKRLLQKYAIQYDDQYNEYKKDKLLNKTSKRDIVKLLISFCLKAQKLNLQDIEEILVLIDNLNEIDLSKESLIIIFIEAIINYNKSEWDNLETIGMYDSIKLNQDDPTMMQILNRSAIYVISKYLYDMKNQARFLQLNNEENYEFGDDEQEQENQDEDNNNLYEYKLWKLWNSGMSFCAGNKDDFQFCYFAVRAFSNAQGK